MNSPTIYLSIYCVYLSIHPSIYLCLVWEVVFCVSYPHLSVAYGGSVLGQPQHIQVHVVLSAPPQAEAKTFGVPLQIHRVELWLLVVERHSDTERERERETEREAEREREM